MGRRRHAYTNGRGGRTKENRQYPADRDDRLTLPPAFGRVLRGELMSIPHELRASEGLWRIWTEDVLTW